MKVLIFLGLLSLTAGISSPGPRTRPTRTQLSPMQAWEITRFVHTLNLLFDEMENVSVVKKFNIYRSRNSFKLRRAIGAAMVKSQGKKASAKKSPKDYLFRQ